MTTSLPDGVGLFVLLQQPPRVPVNALAYIIPPEERNALEFRTDSDLVRLAGILEARISRRDVYGASQEEIAAIEKLVCSVYLRLAQKVGKFDISCI